MISVIVPMYNASMTIEKCLLSICEQSYRDIEIIVVDDGSTDDCVDCVKKMMDRDRRLRLVEKQNGGVSSARNCGIRAVCGDFICFIDSDDYITSDYLSAMYDEIIRTGSDICVSGYCDVFPKYIVEHKLTSEELNSLSGKLEEDLYILRQYINSPCMKLYRLSIIRNNNLLFNEEFVTAEDQLFNYSYYSFCNTVCFVNIAGYMYIRANSGLSRKRTKLCYENELYNLYCKYHFMIDKNIRNGEQIIAETTCYIAKRYMFLSDGSNAFAEVRKRIVKSDILNHAVKLSKKKDRILYCFINKRFILPIYIYIAIRKILLH